MTSMRKLLAWTLLTMMGGSFAAAADDFLPTEKAIRVGAVATAPDPGEVIF